MIETPRLVLRRWQAADAAPYRALAGDPRVARFLGPAPTLTRARATIATQNALLDATGSCFRAAELRRDGSFAGWCGIKPGPGATPIAGCAEIGWSLRPELQGRGLAHEAAAAVLAWTWAHTAHRQVYGLVVPANRASRTLMRRLGMRMVQGGAFDHPAIAAGDPLRRHLVYVIERPA